MVWLRWFIRNQEILFTRKRTEIATSFLWLKYSFSPHNDGGFLEIEEFLPAFSGMTMVNCPIGQERVPGDKGDVLLIQHFPRKDHHRFPDASSSCGLFE